jgi:hypothetical protein
MATKINKHKHKDKFDEDINREGMGTVENEGVSEESGMNPGNKNERSPGDGIEEFIDDNEKLQHGESDEHEKDN